MTDVPAPTKECPLVVALSAIGGKWKVIILYRLQSNTLRFGEIKDLIPGITSKMLTRQLKDMEKDGLLIRTVYAEIPPRVEYCLTPVAQKLLPTLTTLFEWGQTFKSL